jgi:zinc protease
VRKNLVEQLGAGIVSRRMAGLNEAAGKPAAVIGSASPAAIGGVWNGEMATSARVTDVAKTIDVMVKAHRQAVEYGVTQEELDRQISLRIDAVKREAERGRTGTSVSQIETAIDYIDADVPFVSLQQSYALLLEQAPTITLAEVNAALKARFTDTPMMTYRGSAPRAGRRAATPSGGDGRADLGLQAGCDQALAIYRCTPGVAREAVADLNVTKVIQNNVKLRSTAAQQQGPYQRPRPHGLRPCRSALSMRPTCFALVVWRTQKADLTELLAHWPARARPSRVRWTPSLDNLNVAARGLPAQMQIMTAMITDSAYRADDWASWMQASDASDASLKLTPSGVLERELDQLLHSGDLRWTINTKAQRDSWKPEDSIKYIKPIVDNSPIEVIVIGDVGVETVIQEVGKTLGALPARKAILEPKGMRDVKFPKPGTKTMPHKGRPDQGYAMIGWPTYAGAFKNIRDERIGLVLGQMLRDNATRLFRSEGGATYSPMGQSIFDFPAGYRRRYRGAGMIDECRPRPTRCH